MVHVEQRLHAQHRHGVQAVRVYLVLAHGRGRRRLELTHAEHAAEDDQRRGEIHDLHRARPVVLPERLHARPARVLHAVVEAPGHDQEEAEGRELEEQTPEEHVLAERGAAGRGQQRPAPGLKQEGEGVARDEDFGDPGRPDQGEVCGVDEEHDAAVEHVDCGGVQRGWEDDEEGLDDVWPEGELLLD